MIAVANAPAGAVTKSTPTTLISANRSRAGARSAGAEAGLRDGIGRPMQGLPGKKRAVGSPPAGCRGCRDRRHELRPDARHSPIADRVRRMPGLNCGPGRARFCRFTRRQLALGSGAALRSGGGRRREGALLGRLQAIRSKTTVASPSRKGESKVSRTADRRILARSRAAAAQMTMPPRPVARHSLVEREYRRPSAESRSTDRAIRLRWFFHSGTQGESIG